MVTRRRLYFSAVLWLRPLLTYCASQFFQGGGVRLKESSPNIIILMCACRLSWIMCDSCGEYPIRRFPALSD